MIPTEFHTSKPDFMGAQREPWKGPENVELAGKLASRGWRVFVTIHESVANPRTVRGLEDQIPVFKALAEQSGNPDMIAKWSRPADEIRGELAKQKMDEDPRTNHWALLDSVRIDDHGRVSMTVYSYGAKSELPPVDMKTFLQIYGGFVAANRGDLEKVQRDWYVYEKGYEPID